MHRQLTAVDSNRQILENLAVVARRKPVTLRYVLLPGLTDGDAEAAGLIRIIRGLEAMELAVDVLPYHTMGVYKWQELGMDYQLSDIPEPTRQQLDDFKRKLQQAGIKLAYQG